MNYEIFGENILLKKVEDDVNEKTESGLFKPTGMVEQEKRDRSMFHGEVVLAGHKVELVRTGDVVVFNKTGANILELDGEEFYLLPQDNVLAKRVS